MDHCGVCRWDAECAARRRGDDHLSLVAGIGGRQRRALEGRGITTLEGLGDLPLPITPRIEGTGEAAMERVHEQARIQLAGRRAGDRPLYELLLPEPGEPLEHSVDKKRAAMSRRLDAAIPHRRDLLVGERGVEKRLLDVVGDHERTGFDQRRTAGVHQHRRGLHACQIRRRDNPAG